MSDPTKACNLTEDEISYVIAQRGYQLTEKDTNKDMLMERLNYLNKRLKAFAEPDKVEEAKPAAEPTETTPTPKAAW